MLFRSEEALPPSLPNEAPLEVDAETGMRAMSEKFREEGGEVYLPAG